MEASNNSFLALHHHGSLKAKRLQIILGFSPQSDFNWLQKYIYILMPPTNISVKSPKTYLIHLSVNTLNNQRASNISSTSHSFSWKINLLLTIFHTWLVFIVLQSFYFHSLFLSFFSCSVFPKDHFWCYQSCLSPFPNSCIFHQFCQFFIINNHINYLFKFIFLPLPCLYPNQQAYRNRSFLK